MTNGLLLLNLVSVSSTDLIGWRLRLIMLHQLQLNDITTLARSLRVYVELEVFAGGVPVLVTFVQIRFRLPDDFELVVTEKLF